MSGFTSQPNLGSMVEALRHGPRDSGVSPENLRVLSGYWEQVRHGYFPFESELRAGGSEVYVHGMPGGFVAPGAKTVIPAKASAKVSMRMVPNQDPDDILKRYTAFVKKLTPKGIETKIKVWSKGPACVVGTDNRFIKAATEALHDTFKKETVFIRSGGSIPIVTDFQDVLKIPSVMMGFGLPDDNLHAPNEKFHIPNFHRGIETICLFFEKLGG